MLKIKKQKITINANLKKKINWELNYASLDLKINNGNLLYIDPTNLAYVEPHTIEYKNIKYLFFNGHDDFYINDLDHPHKLTDLHKYLILAKKD